MKISASTVCLNVDDVSSSSAFLAQHFGFRELIAADGFASLGRDDVGMSVVFHRKGLEVLPEGFRNEAQSGVILAFTVEDVTIEEKRLREAGVQITLPLVEQPWGERLFQVTDPNGVVIELLQWLDGGPPQ